MAGRRASARSGRGGTRVGSVTLNYRARLICPVSVSELIIMRRRRTESRRSTLTFNRFTVDALLFMSHSCFMVTNLTPGGRTLKNSRKFTPRNALGFPTGRPFSAAPFVVHGLGGSNPFYLAFDYKRKFDGRNVQYWYRPSDFTTASLWVDYCNGVTPPPNTIFRTGEFFNHVVGAQDSIKFFP
jgi:hypothetical protein